MSYYNTHWFYLGQRSRSRLWPFDEQKMYEMSLDPVEKALNREFVQRLDYYRKNHNFRHANQWRPINPDYGAMVQVAERQRFRSAKQDGRGSATMGNY